jgi:hypothetical protein
MPDWGSDLPWCLSQEHNSKTKTNDSAVIGYFKNLQKMVIYASGVIQLKRTGLHPRV